jgi:ApaG protein
MYTSTTRNIAISVEAAFLDEHSFPQKGEYRWAYRIRIENKGSDTITLLTRYWKITDALGRVQEVRGDGVVGQQPTLGPGELFEYTSGTPLSTPSGFMVGTYEMLSQSGEQFAVDIPAFSLDSPHEKVLRH